MKRGRSWGSGGYRFCEQKMEDNKEDGGGRGKEMGRKGWWG